MKKEFIVERDGRTFVLYAGLLDLAHERGLKSITTTLVQIPNELNGNMAICHATVETEQGTFTGLGDACPANVTRLMAPHLIRMAETRAKARALRDAVNVGVTALEELADIDDLGDEASSSRSDGSHARRGLRSVTANGQASRAGQEPDQPRPSEAGGAPDSAALADGQLAAPFARREGGEDLSEPGGVSGLAGRHRADGLRGSAPPATPKQRETIARMARAAGRTIDTEGLTRAQASEIIAGLIDEIGQRRAS